MGPRPERTRPTFFWVYRGGRRIAGINAAKSNRKAERAVKTFAAPQWLGHGGDDAWGDERATDPLHRTGIDSEPFGNNPYTWPSRSRGSSVCASLIMSLIEVTSPRLTTFSETFFL